MGNMAWKLVIVGLVLVAGFVLRGAYEQIIYPSKPAVAQADQYDCASFGSQESAQVELDNDPSDPNNLDADGNGIACDNYPYGTSGSVAASSASPSSPSSGSTPASSPSPSSASPGKPWSSAPAPPRPQKTHKLFSSGGSTDGPVPLMPNGSCPVEFPVKHNGLCHE
jgi:hypothetical protein